MLNKIWRWLTGVPQFLAAAAVLQADMRQSLQDGEIKAAWEKFLADPAMEGTAPRLSAEWRAVEEAINRLR